MTDAFLSLGKMIAKQQGLPELRMIVVPHPLGGLPESEVDQMAIKAAEETLAMLQGDRQPEGKS